MGYLSDSEQKMILAKNLTNYIEISGKDQKQIAVELDINPPTFNQWVNGKAIPSVSTLKRIAAYFNATLSQLVDDKAAQPAEASVHDNMLLSAYKKAAPAIQAAVDKLLDIKS